MYGKNDTITINREISWLSFNERVLQEAADPSVPLIERLKFLGIFSNNRDEFFRVRVATLTRIIKYGSNKKYHSSESPVEILDKIQKIVFTQQNKADKIYKELIKSLQQKNIYFVNEKQLTQEQGDYVREYFNDNVLPNISPLMIGDAKKFPFLKDRAINLFVRMTLEGKKEFKYSIIEIPTDTVNRFVVIPDTSKKATYIIFLDDVIRFCLNEIFNIFNCDKIEAYTIKLTRDSELDLDKDLSQSLADKITKSLKKRKTGFPIRLNYDFHMPKEMVAYLLNSIKGLNEDGLLPGIRYHNFRDFIGFPSIGNAEMVYMNPHPLTHKFLEKKKSIFNSILEKDILLFYPYQSFHHIIDLLRESSIDPDVESIKITLYRAARNSGVINSLINAAKNGKKVTAVIELQARFDEEANIYWGKKMEEEGIQVVYGVQGLKVHSKLFIISKRVKGEQVKIAHIGTGNFNENTAKIYSDISILTADKNICEETEQLFKYYINKEHAFEFKKLLVAPFNMRKKFVKQINKEIENAQKGKQAYIKIKLNNLVDQEMIDLLYRAALAGVKIKLIVRGICSLATGVQGASDNIEAISIVDKYLEHSRIFIFCNEGNEKTYISSADWMTRNLDYRSEVAMPVYDQNLKKIINKIFDIQFADNVKARIIDQNQKNKYVVNDNAKKNRSQEIIFSYFKNLKEKQH